MDDSCSFHSTQSQNIYRQIPNRTVLRYTPHSSLFDFRNCILAPLFPLKPAHRRKLEVFLAYAPPILFLQILELRLPQAIPNSLFHCSLSFPVILGLGHFRPIIFNTYSDSAFVSNFCCRRENTIPFISSCKSSFPIVLSASFFNSA